MAVALVDLWQAPVDEAAGGREMKLELRWLNCLWLMVYII